MESLSDVPSLLPSDSPSVMPSDLPSETPSQLPSSSISVVDGSLGSDAPSLLPSDAPSSLPSDFPSGLPSEGPSEARATFSDFPSLVPSSAPSGQESFSGFDVNLPSDLPSSLPSDNPSAIPSAEPSVAHTDYSDYPSLLPSWAPSDAPSELPTQQDRRGPGFGGNFGGIPIGDSIGRPFCEEPSMQVPRLPCKMQDSEWDRIVSMYGATASFENLYIRQLTGECGPHCRPSCLTLMLDLEQLGFERESVCSHQLRRDDCPYREQVNKVFPESYLEEVTCNGPELLSGASSCVDQTLLRFGSAPIITPIDLPCENECFEEPNNRLFFEYCNVVDDCSCHGPDCPVEPFPHGTTSFVASALLSDEACFAQRIDLTFQGPHCHACPLLQLGDRIGSLEVVGFGRSCAPCDAVTDRETDCGDLLECHETVDCITGSYLELPEWHDHQCSYRDDRLDGNPSWNTTVDDRGTIPVGSTSSQAPQSGGKTLDFDPMSVVVVIAAEVILAVVVLVVWKTRQRFKASHDEWHRDVNFLAYQTASLVQSPVSDEVEAIHVTGASRSFLD